MCNFDCVCVCRSVLWSCEVVWDAGETPAWFYLPETRPVKKGSHVHHYPVQLLAASLGHQNFQSCHSLSYDGKICVYVYIDRQILYINIHSPATWKTADLLGFSRTTISRVYREWSEKEEISSERHLCGLKCLVDVRGQRRMGRLVRDDRKAALTQITTRYNQDIQNTISEHKTRRTLKQMGYSSRRPHRCCSCQLRTGNGDYNSHRLTKIGQ